MRACVRVIANPNHTAAPPSGNWRKGDTNFTARPRRQLRRARVEESEVADRAQTPHRDRHRAFVRESYVPRAMLADFSRAEFDRSGIDTEDTRRIVADVGAGRRERRTYAVMRLLPVSEM